MRVASDALLSFVYSRVPCWKADLFTVTLANGTVYRWTDFDQPVTYGGNTWLSVGPLLERTRIGVKNTVEVPELEIKLAALDTDFIDGLNIKTQLHNGAFDGATLQLDRAFMITPGNTSLGLVLLFAGRMSQAQISATGATLTVKGANVLMNQYVPRNIYQTSCIHTFCDAGCTLVESAMTLVGQLAGAGSTVRVIQWGSAPASPGLYTNGKITFTSGAAIGQVRTVTLSQAGGITLVYPLYDLLAPGDTFSIMKGCDKNLNAGNGQSCTDYANLQHYRGFPFIPPAYTAT